MTMSPARTVLSTLANDPPTKNFPVLDMPSYPLLIDPTCATRPPPQTTLQHPVNTAARPSVWEVGTDKKGSKAFRTKTTHRDYQGVAGGYRQSRSLSVRNGQRLLRVGTRANPGRRNEATRNRADPVDRDRQSAGRAVTS